jgi:alkaline phosphatase
MKPAQPALSRRRFLQAGALGALALGASPWTRAARRSAGAARNAVVLVSDGMSIGTLSLTDQFLQRRDGRGSAWLDLLRDGVAHRGAMATDSLDSLVTDSAAAASAWGSGHRVNNRSLNVAPDGTPHRPLYDYARAAGRRTGLVTTATITHATPAGFAVNLPDRNDEQAIAAAYLAGDIELLLGGGFPFFAAERRADGIDLAGRFAHRGYSVVRTADKLGAAPPGPVLGLFADGHLPFEADRLATPELKAAVPSLAELTRFALARLARDDRGFLLQVEGARVDHAAHDNDLAGLLFDQIAFDDAVAVAREFAFSRDDTLVVVCTDHGNANPGLNGDGNGYRNTNRAFDRVQQFRRTNRWVIDQLGPDVTTDRIHVAVRTATGLTLSSEEVALLQRALRREHVDAYRVRSGALVTLGQLLANHVSVGWNGTAHTSDLVEVAAFGPGAEAFAGIYHATGLHDRIRHVTGLEA